MIIVTILGSLGGVIAAITLIFIIVRGIFKQVSATEDNTEAIKKLTDAVDKLDDRLDTHETRIAVNENDIKNLKTRSQGRPRRPDASTT